MPTFLLHHRHQPAGCPVAFAAWRGFASPLRGAVATSTCPHGGHEIWWTVTAHDAAAALAQLPPWLAERTQPIPVGEIRIP